MKDASHYGRVLGLAANARGLAGFAQGENNR
jgi:hypothetical protein